MPISPPRNFVFVILSITLCCVLSYGKCTEPNSLLITGCGRSGTEYMATLLKASGYKIYHEHNGKHGCVSWSMAVYSLSPWGPLMYKKYQHIFHQVRNPLDVITSWYINLHDLTRDEWIFIRKHIPQISLADSLLVHCAKYWYYWNRKVERMAEWRYQIENIDHIIDEFQVRARMLLNVDLLKTLPRNKNSWADTKNKITWKDLEQHLPSELYTNIVNMASRYGYSTEDAD